MQDITRREYKALRIAPRQQEGMLLARQKKFTLFSGPRLSGKTGASLPCICDHAWNVPDADICVLTISQSVGVDSGVWDQLVNIIIPAYMQFQKERGNNWMQWVKEPHVRSATKKPACEVTNKWGGVTRISLESLNDESEVEERFKSRNYTQIYVPELSNFKERKTFDILSECLRSFNPDVTQFSFLADTNPADEGEDSWIYQIWYVHRSQTYEEYCAYQKEKDEDLPILPEEIFLSFRDSLGLLEFEIADNIFVSQARVNELVAKYAHDKDLYNRYIKGMWVKALSGALFGTQFRESFHIRGDLMTPGNPDPEMLMPHEDTKTLYISIDPGTSKNSAGTIFDKLLHTRQDGYIPVPHFCFLDEVVIVGKNHTLPKFVELLCARMDWWEDLCGKRFKWVCWSDRMVMDLQEPMQGKFYHEVIREVSQGRLICKAAARGPGSVIQRVDLTRRLLYEERIFISRPYCPKLITMFKAIPGDKNRPDQPPTGHKMKHILDAATYGLASECYEEMRLLSINNIRRRREGSGLVSVAA